MASIFNGMHPADGLQSDASHQPIHQPDASNSISSIAKRESALLEPLHS
jgi:hypothetical protein